MTRPFDHATVPLSGTNLIEASAGTGKTHAIGSLYLRLLVESGLRPEEILVVTYTDAATSELRGRIRLRIAETLEGLRHGDDPAALLPAIGQGAVEQGVEEVARRLGDALRSFDMAAIHTIHAFSLRALQEHAFESGSLYDTELVKEQAPLVGQVVDDFWRRRFFLQASPYAGIEHCGRTISPEALTTLLHRLHPGPLVTILPPYSPDEAAASLKACRDAFSTLSSLWQSDREAIASILYDHPGLSRSKGLYRKDEVEALLASMEAYLCKGRPCGCFKGIERFTPEGLGKKLKKSASVPTHPFFTAADALVRSIDRIILSLKAELLEEYGRILPQRKRRDNVRFFDDLLLDLYGALDPERGGEALASLLRGSFKAALIDEFQDTDPVQYEIFRRIYDCSAEGSCRPLFLIGDPKQAIYSFRGADLFAYLRASSGVAPACRFTLEKNWRSIPRLLEGFNRLFEGERNPFVFERIGYHPLASGMGEPEEVFVDESRPDAPPLELSLLDHSSDSKGVLSIEAAEAAATAATAEEIVRLLQGARQGSVRIGRRPLLASDIAVVVRAHQQGAKIRAALAAAGVPAVVQGERGIFSTPEASELLVLLEALAEPGNEVRVRSALATSILGRSAAAIAALIEDEAAWVAMLSSFSRYHQLWLSKGVMAMLRLLMQEEGVRRRLLSLPSGERRLTDLLHAFELLHQREHEAGGGPAALILWLSGRLSDDTATPEEEQMRLETDEAAVRIVTVHVSKGLQYPVVFVPFLWKGAKRPEGVVSCHDDEGLAVRDFGSPSLPDNVRRGWHEALAEELRLFYVALTRARFRCIVTFGRIAEAASPVAYLLLASSATRKAGIDLPLRLREEVLALTPEGMAALFKEFAADSAGSIGFRALPAGAAASNPRLLPLPEEKGVRLELRPFRGHCSHAWRISSFTSFNRHGQRSAELPDRDERQGLPLAPRPDVGEEPSGIFAFDRGARAGIFLHEVFETIDFAAPDREALLRSLSEGLERYGFEERWREPLAGMVESVLEARLGSAEEPFRLGALRPGSWITEMEFFVPLSFVTPELLGKALAPSGSPSNGSDYRRLAESLDFVPVEGMLMGFIDMVFEAGGRWWLLDWKSNYLGDTYEAYGREGMEAAMNEAGYHLQYLLYTVALDRYLSLRVENYSYESHFGGVLYLFLRGVRPGSTETGFYHARPSREQIERLAATLVDGGRP